MTAMFAEADLGGASFGHADRSCVRVAQGGGYGAPADRHLVFAAAEFGA